MLNHLKGISIHQLIEFQVSQTPDAIAVIFEDEQLTYRELNQKANQLAHHLSTLGVKPEVLVGVCVERSLEMIIALLAILKAGGAYVPLDPTYPKERLAFVIEDTQLPILLTQQHLLESIPQHQAHTIYLDSDWQAIAQQPADDPTSGVQPSNLAYTIYTSGSTGRPKGVAIEHRNAVALIDWAREFFTAEQLAGVLASTSLCFDLSVFELFVTLSCGGKVILAADALQLPNLPAAKEVTLINTVPSAIAELLRMNGIPTSVHTINLAGEPLQNALVQKLYQLDHIRQVFNLYGPSEDTTYSTVALMQKGTSELPSIGRPISNTQIYLLDSQFNPVPNGAEGELYISGAGLARGYLNRPELTAEKFIRNRFSHEPGSRLYKTGDLAAYLPDGNLKFLGRIDHQVKIRGFRIELGEIEALLAQAPGVRQSVVVARGDVPGNKRLVAYVVPNPVSKSLLPHVTARNLRNFLKQKLPNYIVPSAFVLLDELPLTLNGKVDRRALPIPQWTRMEEGSYVAPRTPLESQLAEIWSRLLGVEQVGIYDNFCELGGHSLLAIQLVYQVSEAFQIELPLGNFLENPTIAGLAQIIDALCRAETIATSTNNLEDVAVLDPTICPENTLTEPVLELFLTGATGFLGTFLLYELLQQTRSDVYCLVRATSFEEGK
jgi:amino acid adenylation domain-containing protein